MVGIQTAKVLELQALEIIKQPLALVGFTTHIFPVELFTSFLSFRGRVLTTCMSVIPGIQTQLPVGAS